MEGNSPDERSATPGSWLGASSEEPQDPVLRAYRAMIAESAGAGIIVGEEGKILHVFGATNKWLHVRPGTPPPSELEMLDEHLTRLIAAGIRRAQRDGEAVEMIVRPTSKAPGRPQSTYRVRVIHCAATQKSGATNTILFDDQWQHASQEARSVQEQLTSNLVIQSTHEAALSVSREQHPIEAQDAERTRDLAENRSDLVSHQEERDRAQALIEICAASDDTQWMLERDSLRIRFASPGFSRLTGYRPEDFADGVDGWLRLVHDEDRGPVEQFYLDGAPTEIQFRLITRSEDTVFVRGRLFRNPDPSPKASLIGSLENVTRSVEAERNRRHLLEFHRVASEEAPVPMLALRPSGELLWGNAKARHTLLAGRSGWPTDVRDLLTSEQTETWEASLTEARHSGSARCRVEFRNADGTTTPSDVMLSYRRGDRDAESILIWQWVDLSSFVDAHKALSERAEEFEALANSDPLTGLFNRRGLERMLRSRLSKSTRTASPSMALLIDFDRFKEVNDRYDHSVGDHVLREIASRLSDQIRPSDLLARIGGDEFLVVLPETRLAEAAHVGERLRLRVKIDPVVVGDVSVRVTVSIGVGEIPHTHANVDEIVAAVCESLKSSKGDGRDRVSIAAGVAAAGIRQTQSTLKRLLSGQLDVVTQSIHSVEDSTTVGQELLCRGRDPLMMPTKFFESARSAECLEELDLACLQACVERIPAIPAEQSTHVNLFPTTLVDHPQEVMEILQRVQDPNACCIEISEHQFIGSSASLRGHIDRIRELGFKFALDDVGYGHSALETLLALDPDVVKIDRSLLTFVDRDLGARRRMERLVKMFVGHDTRLIAEGVEREEQRQVLRNCGVEIAQGYLWSKPVPCPRSPLVDRSSGAEAKLQNPGH